MATDKAQTTEIDLRNVFTNQAPYSGHSLRNMDSLGTEAADRLRLAGELLAERVYSLNSALHAYPENLEDIKGILDSFGIPASDLLQTECLSTKPLIVPRWLFERETSMGGMQLGIDAEVDACADWIRFHINAKSADAIRHLNEARKNLLSSTFAESFGYWRKEQGLVADYVLPNTMTLSGAQIFRAFSGLYDYTIPVPAAFSKGRFFVFALNHELAHLLRLQINPEPDANYVSGESSQDRSVSSGRDMEGFCDCLATLKHIQSTGDTDFPRLIGDLRTISVLNGSAEKEVLLPVGFRKRPAAEYDTQPHIEAAIRYAQDMGDDFYALPETALIKAAYEIAKQEKLSEPQLRQLEQLVRAPIYSQWSPSAREVQARLDEIEDYGFVRIKSIEHFMAMGSQAESQADRNTILNPRPLGDAEYRIIRAHREALQRLDEAIVSEPKQQYFDRLITDLLETMMSPYNYAPLSTLHGEHLDTWKMTSGWSNYRREGIEYTLEGREHSEGFFEEVECPRYQRDLQLHDQLTDPNASIIDTPMLHAAITSVWEACKNAPHPKSILQQLGIGYD